MKQALGDFETFLHSEQQTPLLITQRPEVAVDALSAAARQRERRQS
jgi:hypothetical protein